MHLSVGGVSRCVSRLSLPKLSSFANVHLNATITITIMMCHHFLSYFHILCMLDWGVGPWTRIRTCETSFIVKKTNVDKFAFFCFGRKNTTSASCSSSRLCGQGKPPPGLKLPESKTMPPGPMVMVMVMPMPMMTVMMMMMIMMGANPLNPELYHQDLPFQLGLYLFPLTFESKCDQS